MRILILGGDGYLGWPTAMKLSALGHEVAVADNMIKRYWEAELGVQSLVTTSPLHIRLEKWKQVTGFVIEKFIGDIAKSPRFVYFMLESFQPDAIVHYAEQPSAPYSMIARGQSVETQRNNTVGTLNIIFAIEKYNPDIHLIKLGTRVLFPKKPDSFYHLSKMHDSANLEFVCRVWGHRVTDLNQGIVYGFVTNETQMDKTLATNIHYDAVFGTVINRFICQVVCGQPLTIYGKGGQTRGYLNIEDTLKSVEVAALNPPSAGEFRVFNQFTEQFSVAQLANKIGGVAREMGYKSNAKEITNPRIEIEDHYYDAKNASLPSLDLVPLWLSDNQISEMISFAALHKENIDVSKILPSIPWHHK